jgi:hypothetical protein
MPILVYSDMYLRPFVYKGTVIFVPCLSGGYPPDLIKSGQVKLAPVVSVH